MREWFNAAIEAMREREHFLFPLVLSQKAVLFTYVFSLLGPSQPKQVRPEGNTTVPRFSLN